MGDIVRAVCHCGYSSEEMLIGGGRRDYLTNCNFPMFCKACHSLFEANLYDKKIVCSECGSDNVLSYDDKSLYKESEEGLMTYFYMLGVTPNRKLQLSKAKNLCPKCDHFSLFFGWLGLYD